MKKIFIFLIALYLILLNAFFNNFNDEADWIIAGKSFLGALLTPDPSATYVGTISMHPGVTILWISAVLQLLFPEAPSQTMGIMHRLAFLSIGSLLAFFLIKWFTNKVRLIILMGMLFFLLLDSHFILSGNLSWLDLLLTFLIPLCALSWLSFLQKGGYKNLFTTGVLMGLSILTKFMGGYLFIILPLVTFLYKRTLKDQLKPMLQVLTVAFFTFILLYPAMWTNPQRVLLSRFSPLEGGHKLSLIENSSLIYSYPNQLAKISPVILLGLILAVMELYKVYKRKVSANLPLLIGSCGVVYILCLFLTVQLLVDKGRENIVFLHAIGRYLLPAFPLLGIYFFHRLFYAKSLKNEVKILIVLLLFIWEGYQFLNP